MKKVLLVIGLILVLGVAGYFTASRVWGFPAFGSSGTVGAKNDDKTSMVSLGQFITNLKDEGRFIRVTVEVEVYADKIEDFNSKAAEAKTDIYALLRSRTYSALSGETGLRDLQRDIGNSLTAKSPGAIKSVFFSEFIVQ